MLQLKDFPHLSELEYNKKKVITMVHWTDCWLERLDHNQVKVKLWGEKKDQQLLPL